MNWAGVLVGWIVGNWQSVAPFFFFKLCFLFVGLSGQNLLPLCTNYVVDQCIVCELNSSRCHCRVLAALLPV